MKQETAREIPRENAKLHISQLPFSAIPDQTRLFLQYLDDPASLRRFYPNAVASVDQLAGYIPTVLSAYTGDRGALCDALVEINESAGSGKATFANIELLRGSDTVAAVTGQQAGLFTGPLYTIYKALSAIKLAALLKGRGANAVPVFWIASEDHDLDEVSRTSFVGRTGELFQTSFHPHDHLEGLPVGAVKIGPEINAVVADLFTRLPKDHFSSEAHEILASSWRTGEGVGDAFAKALARLLNKFGIIVLDPRNARLKSLSAPIYASAVERSYEIVGGLISRSRELEGEGFHSQVLVEPDYFPLFWHDDNGRRLALRMVGDHLYRAKGSRTEFTMSALEDMVLAEPGRFSPGVMLRPVVQDYLLPTVCYFGGGAEIAYFAQNSEVYRVLDRPVTPVLHRQSFTVVEEKQRLVLEGLGFGLADLLQKKEDRLLSLAEHRLSPATAATFDEVEERINSELDRLDQAVSRIDVTIAANLATRRRKILYHIAALRKKTLLAQVRNDGTAGRHLELIYNALVPNGSLQERSLNVFGFVNKYGLNFIDWLHDSIDLEDKHHRIIGL